ncbi:hypothetical protein P4O66_008838 [Electrophorus voltai]|uniref:Endonuclease/exonuclease/phosphatase domain-containing protein n=1 Tax=Electrophorus voltai TaxID=2609070 RepID=A0AAD8ZB04_9TELE|nr:hypothetical protein P4O66_008838 [Electrophorus voltai]
MYRHPNVHYASQAANTNRSMLARPLTAATSAQTFARARRHWHRHQPRTSWWWGQFPEQSWSPSTSHTDHATAPRPPDPLRWREWRQPGLFPHSVPQHISPVHLYSGGMDRADEEGLRKRKRSEDSGSHGNWQRSPKRSALEESQEQSPVWLHITGASLPPGKVPPSSENRGTKTELKREWEEVCGYGPRETGSIRGRHFDFSVMSYNILSQELLLSNAYLYKHCNPLILSWGHRFTKIIKELEQHSADIMCLQEVQEDHYLKQIKPSLESLGYHCEYKRRTGRKPDGCAVVFKRERFSLLSCHPVEYFRRGIPLLDRDNVGLILLLQPVEPSACHICVANTHLLYNPRRGDIKLAQLSMLLAEISRVAGLADGSTCPVVLCGDFNSLPCSPLCSFIRESRLDYTGLSIGKVSGQEDGSRGQRLLTAPIWPTCLGISQQCQYESQATTTDQAVKELNLQALSALNSASGSDMSTGVGAGKDFSSLLLPGSKKLCIEHGLRLTSAYSHYLRENSRPEITTCHARTAVTVDYIFYSALSEYSTPEERGLQLLARLALVGEAELREVNRLPNQHHSSDHLPLIACFRLPS